MWHRYNPVVFAVVFPQDHKDAPDCWSWGLDCVRWHETRGDSDDDRRFPINVAVLESTSLESSGSGPVGEKYRGGDGISANDCKIST